MFGLSAKEKKQKTVVEALLEEENSSKRDWIERFTGKLGRSALVIAFYDAYELLNMKRVEQDSDRYKERVKEFAYHLRQNALEKRKAEQRSDPRFNGMMLHAQLAESCFYYPSTNYFEDLLYTIEEADEETYMCLLASMSGAWQATLSAEETNTLRDETIKQVLAKM